MSLEFRGYLEYHKDFIKILVKQYVVPTFFKVCAIGFDDRESQNGLCSAGTLIKIIRTVKSYIDGLWERVKHEGRIHDSLVFNYILLIKIYDPFGFNYIFFIR